MRSSLILKSGIALALGVREAFAADWEGVPNVGTTIKGVQYLGCAAQIPGGVLPAMIARVSMPIEDCRQICADATYSLFGLWNGNICSCGRYIPVNAQLPGTPADCNLPCKNTDGSSTKQLCGGKTQMSVFNVTNHAGPGPVTDDPIWRYASCYMEPESGGHALTLKESGPNMTVQKCLAVCNNFNNLMWMFAGLENGSDCYCGNTILENLDDASDPACALQCDRPCAGNATQICGGTYTLSAYARRRVY